MLSLCTASHECPETLFSKVLAGAVPQLGDVSKQGMLNTKRETSEVFIVVAHRIT